MDHFDPRLQFFGSWLDLCPEPFKELTASFLLAQLFCSFVSCALGRDVQAIGSRKACLGNQASQPKANRTWRQLKRRRGCGICRSAKDFTGFASLFPRSPLVLITTCGFKSSKSFETERLLASSGVGYVFLFVCLVAFCWEVERYAEFSRFQDNSDATSSVEPRLAFDSLELEVQFPMEFGQRLFQALTHCDDPWSCFDFSISPASNPVTPSVSIPGSHL